MNIFRSELKKLLTLRSTYILTALAFILPLLTVFFTGYKTHGFNDAGQFDSHTYIQVCFMSVNIAAIFAAVLAILIMAHEYRYNLIMYTLTASNSRTKVLGSKLALVFLYAAIITVPVGLSGIAAFAFGAHLQHIALPSQHFPAVYIFGRCLFFLIGYSLAGLLFATLIRNLAASIVVLFIFPGTIEGLLGLLIKSKNQYLPFTSLKQVVVDQGQVPASIHLLQLNHPFRSAITYLIYLIVGWIVGWYLFLHRDAA